MADDQNKKDPSAQDQTAQDQNKNQSSPEADASDLLSLWGGADNAASEPQADSSAAQPAQPESEEPQAQAEEPEQPQAQPEAQEQQKKEEHTPWEEMINPKEETVEPQEEKVEEGEIPPSAEEEFGEEEEEEFKEEKEIKTEEDVEEKNEAEEEPSPAAVKKETPEEEKITKPQSEPAEGEIISEEITEEEPKILDEEESLKEKLDDFLQELNLSRKHVFYAIGCLGFLIILIFGGMWGLKYLKNRKPANVLQPQQKPPTEISMEDAGVVATHMIGASVTVTPDMIVDTGIAATAAVGLEPSSRTEIEEHLMTFRRMQNAYQTNVNELLNQSTDRRARLESHISLLRRLYGEGTTTLQTIVNARQAINAQYDEKIERRNEYDANFFEQVNALNPRTAQNILNEFILISKEIIALRSRSKALQKLQYFYEQALPRISNRIRSLELNEEALVSGIRVYQVGGSDLDLDLIVPVRGEAVETDRLQDTPPSTQILPTNPAQVTTEHDYITQPGGGFSDVLSRQGTTTNATTTNRNAGTTSTSGNASDVSLSPQYRETGTRDFITQPGGGFR